MENLDDFNYKSGTSEQIEIKTSKKENVSNNAISNATKRILNSDVTDSATLQETTISIGTDTKNEVKVNKISNDLFRKIAKEKGMTDKEIDAHLKYIDDNYSKWKEGNVDVRIKKFTNEGNLSRSIEFIKETGTVVTHFKSKIADPDNEGKTVKGKPLGTGQFAVVKSSIINVSSQLEGPAWIADKVPNKNTNQIQNDFIEEGEINREFNNSDNVRKCYRVGEKGLLLEGMKSDLATNLTQMAKDKNLTEEKKLTIAHEIIHGVKEIHEKGYIHQDLHLGNIFVSYHDVCKVGDLGSIQKANVINSKPINWEISSPNANHASAFRTNFTADASDDIWALGIALYTIEYGEPPFFASREICKPLGEAKNKLEECFKSFDDLVKNDNLDETLQCQLLSWDGKSELKIPETFKGNKSELFNLAKQIADARAEVRDCYEVYEDAIKEFTINFSPKNDDAFGCLIKGMLTIEPENRIPIEDAEKIINKLKSDISPSINSQSQTTTDSEKEISLYDNTTSDYSTSYSNTTSGYSYSNTTSGYSYSNTTSGYSNTSNNVTSGTDYNDAIDDAKNYSDDESSIDEFANEDIESLDDLEDAYTTLNDEMALRKAISRGDVDVLKEMVLKKCDVANWRGAEGKTLLHLALEKENNGIHSSNDRKLIEFLLEIGSDVNAKDERGMTSLHYAMDRIQFLPLLMKKTTHPIPKNNEGITPLMMCDASSVQNHILEAIKLGNSDLLDSLCLMGVHPLQKFSDGRSPLEMAIDTGNAKIVKHLLDHQQVNKNGISAFHNFIDIDLQSNKPKIFTYAEGNDPFSRAISMDNPQMVRVFLDKNLELLNMKDSNGNTPLHTAAKEVKLQAFFVLCKYGGDINLENKFGKSPRKIAEKSMRFLDENKLLIGTGKLDPTYVEWYKNQATMLEFITSADITNEAKEKLMLLTLQAYSKVAAVGPDRAEVHKMQVSPLFPSEIRYHRSSPNEFLNAVEDRLWFEGNNKKHHLISSPLFIEPLARSLSGSGEVITIEGLYDIHKLGKEVASNPNLKKPILVDLTKCLDEDFISAWNRSGLNDHDVFAIAFEKTNGLDVLYVPDLKCNLKLDSSKVKLIIQENGYVLSPDQIKEAWLKIVGFETILSEQGVGQSVLATKGSKFPIVCANFDELLNRNTFKNFKNLSNDPTAATYLQILPEATCLLLEGLKDRGVDEAFKEEGLQDLLQVSYHKIIDGIGMANHNRDNMAAFQNNIEQIHQEIQNILAVMSIKHAISPDKLSESIALKLTGGPEPIIPNQLGVPGVYLKPSAMRCISSALAGVEAEKGSRDLNIVVLKDSYYECSKILDTIGSYNQNFLDGDKFIAGGDNIGLEKMPEKKSIDLFLCEIHHNISLERNEYHKEDILKQFLALNERELLADKCTIMIDSTLDLELSPEMREFFNNPQVQQLIEEGKLNVVSIRSAQKFDMVGIDNYYGGISIAVNNPEHFNAFNSRMKDSQDQLGGLAYQGLSHLHSCLGDTQDNYRKAIMKNTLELYNNLPPQMKMSEENNNPIQFATINDENSVYLHIKSPKEFGVLPGVIPQALKKMSAAHQVPFTNRSSFGFSNMNVTVIKDDEGFSRIRLNPGLEGPEQLRQYKEFFAKLQEVIDKTLEEAIGMNDTDRRKMLWEAINTMDYNW